MKESDDGFNELPPSSDKFWGRIHLAISLVGRRSPLSLDNKVILYKQILRPVITYGSPVWRAAATTHMKKIQNLGGRTGTILRPSSVPLKSKNQEINRLQLAVKTALGNL
ncbi:hypothetical protein TNCV_2653141 [Trichonephila clavipes]|nr:hypothetical protein TNCV_2653141 [Trichonephila clavipes]